MINYKAAFDMAKGANPDLIADHDTALCAFSIVGCMALCFIEQRSIDDDMVDSAVSLFAVRCGMKCSEPMRRDTGEITMSKPEAMQYLLNAMMIDTPGPMYSTFLEILAKHSGASASDIESRFNRMIEANSP